MSRRKTKIKITICIVLCVALLINFTYYFIIKAKKEEKENNLQVITVWQIDSFEGGKGSRAEYIRKKGVEYAKGHDVYIDVVSITADAVRNNLDNGVKPDIISYGSGMYGLECYVNQDYDSRVWCRGGYCILSIETDDFSLVTDKNTIINCGKENFTSVAALFCGLNNADKTSPASAYVKLINGDYKFLLGTQRDIVRLQTRGLSFYVQPVTFFNDLYQNFSVLAETGSQSDTCNDFIEYIIENSCDVSSLCLFYDGLGLYSNELSEMEGVTFDFTVPGLVNEDYYNEISKIVALGDTDKLKSLLKSL